MFSALRDLLDRIRGSSSTPATPVSSSSNPAFEDWQAQQRLWQVSEKPLPPSIRASQRGEAESYFRDKRVQQGEQTFADWLTAPGAIPRTDRVEEEASDARDRWGDRGREDAPPKAEHQMGPTTWRKQDADPERSSTAQVVQGLVDYKVPRLFGRDPEVVGVGAGAEERQKKADASTGLTFEDWQEGQSLWNVSEQPVPPAVRERLQGEAEKYFAQKAAAEGQPVASALDMLREGPETFGVRGEDVPATLQDLLQGGGERAAAARKTLPETDRPAASLPQYMLDNIQNRIDPVTGERVPEAPRHMMGPVGDDYVRGDIGIRPAPSRGPVDQVQGLIDQAFQGRNRVPGDAGIAPEKTGIGAQENPEGTEEMSWEEFKQLGPRQRALVDLNSLLADASAADLALGDASVPKEARETYDTLAKELGFDGNRGSERYAPNTLALIEQLGLNTGTRDLDEFLDLSVGATRDELETIRGGDKKWTRRLLSEDGPTPDKYSRLRASEQRRWAEEAGDKIQEAMTASLEKGNAILNDFRSTMEAGRVGTVRQLGGESQETERGLGFGNTEEDQYFQRAYRALQDPAGLNDHPAFFAELRRELGDEGLNTFFKYADSRSRNERRYGLPELPEDLKDVQRLDPKEFRDILGFSNG